MQTCWVLGKGVAATQFVAHELQQAGAPQVTTPSLQRQTSHHSSLAAVVFGMMQASKRNVVPAATRRFFNAYMIIIIYVGVLLFLFIVCANFTLNILIEN